jgi:hypothetical protein
MRFAPSWVSVMVGSELPGAVVIVNGGGCGEVELERAHPARAAVTAATTAAVSTATRARRFLLL